MIGAMNNDKWFQEAKLLRIKAKCGRFYVKINNSIVAVIDEIIPTVIGPKQTNFTIKHHPQLGETLLICHPAALGRILIQADNKDNVIDYYQCDTLDSSQIIKKWDLDEDEIVNATQVAQNKK